MAQAPSPTARAPGGLGRLLRRAWATMAASVVTIVVLWAGFIHTAVGEAWDDLLYRERIVESAQLRGLNTDVLDAITVVTLALGLLLLILGGAIRHRWFLGLSAAGLVVGAAVSAEVLKRLVIQRPVLTEQPPAIAGNSFPSGHATISTALALAVLLLTPAPARKVVAVITSLWAGFQVAGVVAAGWHRPSDAVAGALIALAWGCIAIVVLVRGQRVGRAADDRHPGRGPALALAVVAVLTLVLLTAVSGSSFGPTRAEFVVAMVVLTCVGVGAVWWFWWLIDEWSMGRSHATERQGAAIDPATGLEHGSPEMNPREV